jgi:Fic family protein
MIYTTPELSAADRAVLDLIAKQRDRLRAYTHHNPRRWLGSLRRTTFARAIQGSNSIEGYHASMDEAIAAIDGEPPLDERTETWFAIKGYRDALTYIMQAAQDSYFEFGKQFLKSLHFMMVGFDMQKHPGQWRPGGIFVVNARSGETVYEGPDADLVDSLVQELAERLTSRDAEPPIMRAAMAHLNLTMIHPFRDGNGRMARALQTLVLSRDGALHPVFTSIEEWLGRNTQEYYDVLALVGQGHWNPHRDASPWVKFCLKAHHQQAATLIRRNEEYESLYNIIVDLVASEHLPERTQLPLFDAALGITLTNSRYRSETELTDFSASRELRRLCEVNLLEPRGEKRARTYSAAKKLKNIRDSVRKRTPLVDPYDLVASRKTADDDQEPRLPGF